MKVKKTKLDGVLIIEPEVFDDERGYFYEAFNREEFAEVANVDMNFVQINRSMSNKNVLRGFHMQAEPFEQAKIVSVIAGAIFDVVVDVRPDSHQFGQWFGMVLDHVARQSLYAPKGFAHGFLSLADDTIVEYAVDAPYAAAHQKCLAYNDATAAVDWPIDGDVVLNERDRQGATLQELFPKVAQR